MHMRRVVAVVTFYSILCASVSASAPVTTESEQPKHDSLLKHLFSKKGLVLTGFSTVVQHIRRSPHEWGSNAGALGKRFAGLMGQRVIRNSVTYGMAKALKQDLKYYPSEQSGFLRRVRHALVSTVIARKKDSKDSTVATAQITGTAAGAFLSRLWQPVRLRTIGSGFSSLGISLSADAGLNVVREFWPRRHKGERRQEAAGSVDTDADSDANTGVDSDADSDANIEADIVADTDVEADLEYTRP
jgi:hypothetical protein